MKKHLQKASPGLVIIALLLFTIDSCKYARNTANSRTEEAKPAREFVLNEPAPLKYSDNTATVEELPLADVEKKEVAANQKNNNDKDFNTEAYNYIQENEFKRPGEAPLSTFSIDVDVASYGMVRKKLEEGQTVPKDAVRIEELVNYFTYNYPEPENGQPFSVNTELSTCPWYSGHKLLRIGIHGKKIETEKLPASNLVFLIDVSGSMDEANKLPLVKNSLRLLVNQLNEKDRVAIVTYAGSSGLALPSTPCKNKEKILQAIEDMEAGGSTNGAEGINLAYQVAKQNLLSGGNNRVILCTDGDFNVGVTSDGDLIRLIEEKRNQGIFLSVLGYGMGNYKDSKMEQLADKGNGNYAYIDNLFEAKKNLVDQMGGTLLCIAKDVKIQVEFNPALVKGYRLIGYENRLLNNEDFNDDTKDAGEIGAGTNVTAFYEITTDEHDASLTKPAVDALKYQQGNKAVATSQELLTVKLRYKEPKEDKSKLIEMTVNNNPVAFASASRDFRFAASVASFGLLLRDSKFKGQTDLEKITEWARNAKGEDSEGYRSEFIKLLELAKQVL